MEIEQSKKCCHCKYMERGLSMSPIIRCFHPANSEKIYAYSSVHDERNDLTGNCKSQALMFEPYVLPNNYKKSWFLKLMGG